MTTANSRTVAIDYFSDVLCVWAYVAQVRVDELRQKRRDAVSIQHHFMPLFASTRTKIERNWGSRGGSKGYSAHVQSVGERFSHVTIHPEIWTRNAPRSSVPAHELLKALSLLVDAGELPSGPQPQWHDRNVVEAAAWQLRLAFFRDLEDVSARRVHNRVLDELGVAPTAVDELMNNGAATAALFDDFTLMEQYHVHGSPTFVMNEGRQVLYGNVGYRVIDANVEEMLHHSGNQASWC